MAFGEALGQVYLEGKASFDHQDRFDSFLPEFVRHSDVFNKEVKSVLLKITEPHTSNPSTPSHTHSNRPHTTQYHESRVEEQNNFARRLVDQKNYELESCRREIEEIKNQRLLELEVTQGLEHKIRVLEQEKEQASGDHSREKEILQERIIKIEEVIEGFISNRDEPGGGQQQEREELQGELEVLRERMRNAEGNATDMRVDQLVKEIADLREANGLLGKAKQQVQLQLEVLSLGTSQVEEFRTKLIRQESQLLRLRTLEAQQPSTHTALTLTLRQNEIQHLLLTIESQNRDIESLRRSLQQTAAFRSKLESTVYPEHQQEYLQQQITSLRTQILDSQKREGEAYQQKLNLEREIYGLNEDIQGFIPLKSELETRKFQLEIIKDEVTRLKGDNEVLKRENKDSVQQKQYYQETVRVAEHQKQEISVRYQMLERENCRLKQLEIHFNSLNTELEQYRDRYFQACKKESEVSLKLDILTNQHFHTRNALEIRNQEQEQYKASFEKMASERRKEVESMERQLSQSLKQRQVLESRSRELENMLGYNGSKIAGFEATLVEFQQVHRETAIELEDIRITLSQLQQLENIFVTKEPIFSQLIIKNLSKLSNHKETQRFEEGSSFKVQRRITLFAEISQLVLKQGQQISDLNKSLKRAQQDSNDHVAQIDRHKLHINTLQFQKQRLFNEVDSLLEKLRYVEGALQQQNTLVTSKNQETEQLRRMHKHTHDRLGQQMQRTMWLQSRLDLPPEEVQKARAERTQALARLRSILQ